MAKISILIVFLTHFLCALGQRQLSQCSEYFTYMTKPGTTDMLGQIEILPPSANDTFYLRVALSTTTELSQVVRLELARSIKESVGRVHQGKPLLYHIYCPMNEQIPSLSAMWFNNQRYCPDPEVSGNITANIELVHTLFPPNKEPLVYGSWQEISQPYHRNSSNYPIHNPSYDRLNLNNSTPMIVSSTDEIANNECGITLYYTDDTNRLASDGEKTSTGQWPWLVAIYVQATENEYRFKCTGSILTTRHIITNGRCMIIWRGLKKYELININSQRIYVCFGQLNSREWHVNHTGIINREVVDYKLSSEGFTTVHVLAILILKAAVQYNPFIKPICLWSGSTNLHDTVNITGYIVGWGRNFGRNNSGLGRWEMYTGDLRMAKVPLMDFRVNTIEEKVSFYHSNFSCSTDIGGGLVVFNTTMGRYQLRGVTVLCWLQLIVFLDVTKATSWIQQQMLLT